MMTAAFSPEGAAGSMPMMAYVAENARLFDAGVNAIPGLRSMPLESTLPGLGGFLGHRDDAGGVYRPRRAGREDRRQSRAPPGLRRRRGDFPAVQPRHAAHRVEDRSSG